MANLVLKVIDNYIIQYKQALADVRSTDAGIKGLYCTYDVHSFSHSLRSATFNCSQPLEKCYQYDRFFW